MSIVNVHLTFIFDLRQFIDLHLFQRGYYQLKLRFNQHVEANESVKILPPTRWNFLCERLKCDEAVSQSCVEINTEREQSEYKMASKVIYVQYIEENIYFNDVFEQELIFQTNICELNELFIKNPVDIIAELFFADEPNNDKTNSEGENGVKDEKYMLEKLSLVSTRTFRLNYFPQRGLHYIFPVTFDYLHFCRCFIGLHAALSKIEFIDENLNNKKIAKISIKSSQINLTNGPENLEHYKAAASALLSARESMLLFWKSISPKLPKNYQIDGSFNCVRRLNSLFNFENDEKETNENCKRIIKKLGEENIILIKYLCKIYVTKERVWRFIHERSELVRLKLEAEAFFFQEFILSQSTKDEISKNDDLANIIKKSPYFNNIPNLPLSLVPAGNNNTTDLTHNSIIFEQIFINPGKPSIKDYQNEIFIKRKSITNSLSTNHEISEIIYRPTSYSNLSKSPTSIYETLDSLPKTTNNNFSSHKLSNISTTSSQRSITSKYNFLSPSYSKRHSLFETNHDNKDVKLIGYRLERPDEFCFDQESKHTSPSSPYQMNKLRAQKGFGSLCDINLSQNCSPKATSNLPVIIEKRRRGLARFSLSMNVINERGSRSSFYKKNNRISIRNIPAIISQKMRRNSTKLPKIGSYSDIYNAVKDEKKSPLTINNISASLFDISNILQTNGQEHYQKNSSDIEEKITAANGSEPLFRANAGSTPSPIKLALSPKSSTNSSPNESFSLSDEFLFNKESEETSPMTIMDILKPKNSHIYMKNRNQIRKVLRTTMDNGKADMNILSSKIDGKSLSRSGSKRNIDDPDRLLEPISSNVFNFLAMKAELKTFLSFDQDLGKNQRLDYAGNLYSDYALLPTLYSDFVANNSESLKKDKHLLVFVHGLEGNYADLRLVQKYLKLAMPDHEFESLLSDSNECDTFIDIQVMGNKLAIEIRTHIECVLRKAPTKISFIGHSMGNLIIRSAVVNALLEEYRPTFHTFLSLNGPHLGTVFCSSNFVTAGIWIMQKWKNSQSLQQLRLKDNINLRECCLYKMSENSGFDLFKNIILVSSPQDKYVPYHSTRVEKTKEIIKDSYGLGQIQSEMVDNIINSVIKSEKTNLIRLDINHVGKQNSAHDFIGRTAHIAVLDSDELLSRIFNISLKKYFL